MNIGARVPTEILCEIFFLLRDDPIALHELKNRSPFYDFPWAVGQVCRHWRSVFLSYPDLWSSLSMEDPRNNSSTVSYVAEMERRTAIYLRRSEPWPLTLIVNVSSSFVEGFSKEVWDMLFSCSDRWKKLDLWISNESFMDGLISRRGKMPILESLKLSMHEFKCRKDLTAFEIAPRLIELELINNKGEGGRAFPWAQLTKLTIGIRKRLEFNDSHGLRPFLLQLQNVEELQFFISEGFDTLKCPPVRFARLRLLQTSLVYPGVFSWFEAPLLEDLWVSCDPCPGTYGPGKCNEELSSLAHRSHCHIRHLTLENCEVEVAHSIMEALTSVEKPSIQYTVGLNYGPRLVQDIAEADSIYLPNLRVLRVSCCAEFFERYASAISRLFEVRNRQPRLAPTSSEIASRERLMVTVDWTGLSCYCCGIFGQIMKSRAIENELEAMCGWPSFSVTGLHTNPGRWNLPTLTVCASAAGALIDLTINYPAETEICHNISY